MWIVFAVAALVMFAAGVVGSIIVKTDINMIPAVLHPHLPLMENLGVAIGICMALVGVALVSRKLGKFSRVMSPTSASARFRRTRMLQRARGDEGEVGGAEEEAADAGGPAPGEGSSEPGTRRMRGLGGQ